MSIFRIALPVLSVVATLAVSVRVLAEPEEPLGHRLLAAPERALDLLAVPVRAVLIWAEDVNLPARVRDVLYFNEERTAGWLPDVEGGGPGLSLFHNDLLGGGEQVTLSAGAGIDGEEWAASLSFFDPAVRAAEMRVHGQLAVSNIEDGEVFVATRPGGEIDFGRGTTRDDEKAFSLQRVAARLDMGRGIGSSLRIGIVTQPSYSDAGAGRGAEPPLSLDVPGNGSPVWLLGAIPYLEWDGRDSPVRPQRGGYVRVEGGYFAGLGGRTSSGESYGYARYGADLRYHLPLFLPGRSLVVRGRLDRAEANGAIPFWALPVLDEDNALRGFERNRFLDRGALLFNVEYRYPIWDTWDAFLLLDEGQTFAEYSDVSRSGFEWSAGGGFRFLTESRFLAILVLAVSEEDLRAGVELERPF